MKKKWHPTKVERKVHGIARRGATKQLMRVPWGRFHKAYEAYLRWEALALWIRAIVKAEGSVPSWLPANLKKRCPGFIENKTPMNEPRLLGFRLQEWVHNQIFAHARQEGWLDALIFYGVRDLRSQSIWAYWEHCEQEWHRRRPSSYPKFENWLRSARKYNPTQDINVANVADAVERYIELKMFVCWLQPVATAGIEVPRRVAGELERRCPGFLKSRNSDDLKSHEGKARTGGHLMRWIDDHFFSQAKKDGCFDMILIQARNHPLYVRIVQYSKHWNKSRLENPTAVYPSLAQWRRAAENHVED